MVRIMPASRGHESEPAGPIDAGGSHDHNTPPRVRALSSAAERTGLSIRTLRRRIATGDLTAYRSGSRISRVDPVDVDRLLVHIPTARS